MLDLESIACFKFGFLMGQKNYKCKMTPLMLSAKIGSLESTKLLLKLGANPDFETKGNGLTAIQIASVEEHTEVVWHIFLSLIRSTKDYHSSLL